jgi:hypothetical protein
MAKLEEKPSGQNMAKPEEKPSGQNMAKPEDKTSFSDRSCHLFVICGQLLTEGKTSSGHMSKNVKSAEVKSTQWQTVSYFI